MQNELSLYVYDKELNFKGIIDSFESLRWRRKYFEPGEFELHILFDKNTRRFLKKDYFLVREDAKEVGIIENLQITDNGKKIEVILIGRFLSSILDRRIVKNQINYRGNILDGERKLLSEMTPFKNLEISTSNLDSDFVAFQCTYKNISKYLTKLAIASNIGHRIILDLKRKKMIFENYAGLDRTDNQKSNPRYEFSEDKENITISDYSYVSKEEKNYILVGGQGEGENRVLVEMKSGDFEDLDLREGFVDAKNENKENLTDLEYIDILKNKGKENLLEPSQSIEISVSTKDYKIGWDLGDIVNVKKESWDISLRKRITEIEEIYEPRNRSVFVTFGNPISDKFQDAED